jgi:hypothetical protein
MKLPVFIVKVQYSYNPFFLRSIIFFFFLQVSQSSSKLLAQHSTAVASLCVVFGPALRFST